jgi:hypothetical protein
MTTVIVGASDTLETSYFAPDTIYEFIYDHDLDDEVIELPSNVILRFNGGSLESGTLTGNNTIIESPKVQIFKNIKIRGTWDVKEAWSSWFFTHADGYRIEVTDPDFDNLLYRQQSTDVPPAANPFSTGDDINGYEYKYWFAAPDNVNPPVPVTYDQGEIPPVSYTDDTSNLQQLLNLRARHTTIESRGTGVYMIETHDYTVLETAHDDLGGLLVSCMEGGVLTLNATLKAIPTASQSGAVLRIANTNGFTLQGSGRIQGELCEHNPATGGEAGMGLYICSSRDLTVKGITVELCWGDCVFASWDRGPSLYDEPFSATLNQQFRHTLESVKMNYGRRSNLVYELGDHIKVLNCQIDNAGKWSGTSTFSGVDIEPFGSDDTRKHYCRNFEFHGNRIRSNRQSGIRAERCIGIDISTNFFEGNYIDIELLNNYSADKFINWFPTVTEVSGSVHPEDITYTNRKTISGSARVYSNESYGAGYFLVNADTYGPSKVIAENNYIQNCGVVFGGVFVDSSFRYNRVYDFKKVGEISAFINSDICNNDFHHVSVPYVSSIDNSFLLNGWSTGAEIGQSGYKMEFSNVRINNNVFHDYSGQRLWGSGENGNSGNEGEMTSSGLMKHMMAVGEPTGYFEMKENRFPSERMVILNHFFYGSLPEQVQLECNVGNLANQKILMLGDIVWDDINKQKGITTQAGYLLMNGIPDSWIEFEASKTIPAMTIFYEETVNGIIASGTVAGGQFGSTFPPAWQTSGTVENNFPMALELPEIEWLTTGTCLKVNLPTTLNSVGREMYVTDEQKLAIWSGSAWLDSLGVAI